MGKVKAEPSCIHIGAGLFHMVSQYQAEGFLQQMGGAVVLTDKGAVLFTD